MEGSTLSSEKKEKHNIFHQNGGKRWERGRFGPGCVTLGSIQTPPGIGIGMDCVGLNRDHPSSHPATREGVNACTLERAACAPSVQTRPKRKIRDMPQGSAARARMDRLKRTVPVRSPGGVQADGTGNASPPPPPPGHTAARAHDMRIHPQPPPSTHPPPPVSGSASITLPRPPNTAAAQLFVPAAVAAIANASAVAVDRTSARLFCAIEQSFPDDDGNSLENFQGGCDDRAVILGAVGFSAKGETQ